MFKLEKRPCPKLKGFGNNSTYRVPYVDKTFNRHIFEPNRVSLSQIYELSGFGRQVALQMVKVISPFIPLIPIVFILVTINYLIVTKYHYFAKFMALANKFILFFNNNSITRKLRHLQCFPVTINGKPPSPDSGICVAHIQYNLSKSRCDAHKSITAVNLMSLLIIS